MSDVITRLEHHIAEECTIVDREARFDAMLDECYSFEKVGGPFEWMSPSKVLKEMDPTAYRCGVNDFADGEEWVEVGWETYDRREAEDAKQEFLEELEARVADLEQEIEDAEEEMEAAEANGITDSIGELETGIDKLRQQLAEAEAEVKEVNRHCF